LIDDKDAAAVMKACNVDLDVLRRSLTNYIEKVLDEHVAASREGKKKR
jgi:ATP-dependent Clp protease ATP-binding subunit ClpA